MLIKRLYYYFKKYIIIIIIIIIIINFPERELIIVPQTHTE